MFGRTTRLPTGSWPVFHARVDQAWVRLQQLIPTDGHLAVVWPELCARSPAPASHHPDSARCPSAGDTSLTIVDPPSPWRVRLLQCVAISTRTAAPARHASGPAWGCGRITDQPDLARSDALALLARHARTKPTAVVAFRPSISGLYRERTWRDYARAASRRPPRPAAGSASATGERVAIMGDACEEWLLADLGGAGRGRHRLRHLSDRVGGRGRVPDARRRRVDLRRRGPGVRGPDPAARSIACPQLRCDRGRSTPRRCSATTSASSAAGDASLERARAPAASARPRWRRSRTRSIPAIRRSSSTPRARPGHPKGALVAHGTASRRRLQPGASTTRCSPSAAAHGRLSAALPHPRPRHRASRCRCSSELVPHFGEDVEDLPRTLFEVAPTVLFTVPRYLQKFASQVLVACSSTTPLQARSPTTSAMRARPRATRALGREAARREALAYRARACAGVPAAARTSSGSTRLELVDLRRRAAAAGDDGAVADLGRERRARSTARPRKPARSSPASADRFRVRATSARSRPGWELKLARRRRDPGARRRTCSTATGATRQATREVQRRRRLAAHRRRRRAGRTDGLRLIDRARDFIVTAGGKTLSPPSIENRAARQPVRRRGRW